MIPFQPKAPPQPVVRDPNNKEAPFGRDDNDKPIVPIRPDQQLAADLQEKEYLNRGDCPHGNDSQDCLLCGTKDVVLRPTTGTAPAPHLQKVLDAAFDKSFELNRPVRLPFLEHAIQANMGSDSNVPATPDKPKPEITSYRQALQITPQDIIGLFDKTFEEDQIIDVKVFGDRSKLEDDICELERHIEGIEAQRSTYSAIWWRRNHPDEIPPGYDPRDPDGTKNAFKRLKYEADTNLKKDRAGLKELRQRLNNWETDERNFTLVKQPQKVQRAFSEKCSGVYKAIETDIEFIPDVQRKVEGIPTHYTEIMYYVDTPVGPEFSEEGYRRLVEKQGDTTGWRQWENMVLLEAIKCGIVKPDPSFFNRFPHLKKWKLVEEVIVSDRHEKTLIRKTSGGQIGGSIYARGTRNGKERPLEDFNTTRPGSAGGEGPFDLEPSAPDLTGDSDDWTPD